jgi:CRP/FNR family transcriptional regulator
MTTKANNKFTKNLDECLKNHISNEWMIILKNLTESLKFKKGDAIFQEGDAVKGVYFINSGKVKVVSNYENDENRILRLSHGGHFLGHRALTSKMYPISAFALTEVSVTFIPMDIFHKLIKNNPDFAIFILEFTISDLKDSEFRMKAMIHSDVIVRVAIVLCMLIDSYGYSDENPNQLHFTLPRYDIANMSGTTYESVIRNLAKLESMKVIKLVGKNIVIAKEKELRKIALNKI